MAAQPTILVAADRWGEREAMVDQLRAAGFCCTACDDLGDVEHFAATAGMILLQVDSWDPELSEPLARIGRRENPTPVLLIASHEEVREAAGICDWPAVECLVEPIADDQLRATIWRMLDASDRADWMDPARADLDETALPHLVAGSKAMKRVVYRLGRAAESNAPVLLIGEKGTGKGVIARKIHTDSPRRSGPFVSVNVATMASSAVAARVFGTEVGTNGSAANRAGELSAAEGGTLFVEEISYLSRTAQARLARALERHRTSPLGSNREESIDVRLIASTTRDLEELVFQNRFRADLYYALAVVPIHVPPLRHRRSDIPAMVRRFLGEIGGEEAAPGIEPAPELMRLLEDYHWPGNIRQLRDCVRAIAKLSRSQRMGPEALPAVQGRRIADPLPIHQEKRLAELERIAMVETLEQHGGNRTAAAQALGISVRTLQRKLKKWNAEQEQSP